MVCSKHPPDGSFSPFWFLVETERNVFLWRRGCSIIQQDEFDFWVEVEALCKKRIRQLEIADPENPFANPNWGAEEGAKESDFRRAVQKEIEYLESLMESVNKIMPHLNALCHVGSILEREAGEEAREKVVLPVKAVKAVLAQKDFNSGTSSASPRTRGHNSSSGTYTPK